MSKGLALDNSTKDRMDWAQDLPSKGDSYGNLVFDRDWAEDADVPATDFPPGVGGFDVPEPVER